MSDENEHVFVKAITIHQPWASAIRAAAVLPDRQGKRYETRTWCPKSLREGRMVLAIHSAMTATSLSIAEENPFFKRRFSEAGIKSEKEAPEDVLPFGHVVAVAVAGPAIGTENHRFIESLTEEEKAFGDFSSMRLAWPLLEIAQVKEGLSRVGQQGLWETRFSKRELGDEAWTLIEKERLRQRKANGVQLSFFSGESLKK